MKKLLALVLALVMTLGLATVSSSAAEYSDADSIKYKEAVDVMSAIGVLQGDNGAFNPTGTLTREQGAKILTYMLLGKTAADSLSVSYSPFDDVAPTRWSAGSIAYCKSIGILNGNGDGTVTPDAPLTGAAFAKMLLVALGYDTAREGLTGGDWTLSVASLVNRTALANDIPAFNINTPITRQEAAQLGLNTLKATMVEYAGNLTADNKGNLVAQRTDVRNTEYDYRSTGAACVLGAAPFAAGTTMQFVENYFPNLKLVDGIVANTALAGSGNNDFGVVVDRWFLASNRFDYTRTSDKTIVTAEKADAKTVYTDTAKDVTSGNLYTLAGDNAITYTVKENGAAGTGITVAKGNTTKVLDKYKGATIKILDTTDNGNADTIDVEYAYLAKVTKVTEATAKKDRFITMEVYNKLTPTTGVEFETEDFAKDDYVLVYPKGTIATTTLWATASNATQFNAADNIIKVEAAQSVNGTVSAVTGANGTGVTAITLDATKYNAGDTTLAFLGATKGTDTVATTTYGLGNGYTLYLANGYVLGVKGDSAEYTDYVYVAKTALNSTGLTNFYDVSYITQDGVAHTAKSINNVNSGAATWATIEEDSANEGYQKFTVKGTNSLTLTNDGTNYTLDKKQPTITTSSVVANSNTMFMIRSGATDFDVYTGIANVGSWTTTTTINTVSVVMDGSYARLVYVDMQTGANSNSSDTPVYLLKLDGSAKIGNKNYYNYAAIVDGKLDIVTATASDLLTAVNLPTTGTADYSAGGALVTLTKNADGYATSAKAVDVRTDGNAYANRTTKYLATANPAVAFSNGTLTVAGTAYTAGDAPVYYYNSTDDELKVGTGEDIVGTVSGYVWIQFSGNSDATVKAVWVAATGIA